MRAAVGAFLAILLLAGCSGETPPQGRWEGTWDTAEAMVAARVEIDAKGLVRLTAPNAEDIGDAEDERAAMRANLAAGLAKAWDEVLPREMEFDGKVFRKPGGIAPQMLWDKSKKKLDLVVYLGKKPSIRIPLREVSDFSDDPFGF